MKIFLSDGRNGDLLTAFDGVKIKNMFSILISEGVYHEFPGDI